MIADPYTYPMQTTWNDFAKTRVSGFSVLTSESVAGWARAKSPPFAVNPSHVQRGFRGCRKRLMDWGRRVLAELVMSSGCDKIIRFSVE